MSGDKVTIPAVLLERYLMIELTARKMRRSHHSLLKSTTKARTQQLLNQLRRRGLELDQQLQDITGQRTALVAGNAGKVDRES